MPVHRLFVERVDFRGLGRSSGRNDFLGDGFDGCPVASREEEPRSLARKRAGNRAADRASGAIDHCDFVLQHRLFAPQWLCGVGKHHASLILQSLASISSYSLVTAAFSVTPRNWMLYPCGPWRMTNGYSLPGLGGAPPMSSLDTFGA